MYMTITFWYIYFVLALQSEPPIQSKRRTPGPPTTLTNGFYEDGMTQEDYALLGNQDKFAENVKYKVRPPLATRDPSPPKQMKLQKVLVVFLLNPFPNKPLFFPYLQHKSFENAVGKGEIACNEQFLPFQHCFLSIWRTFAYFHQM